MRPGLTLRTAGSSGSRRILATLADQFVSSASNFALGVVVARAGGAAALGAFGVALVVWLAVVGVNRALVAEPLTVTGSREQAATEQREGLFASALLGVAAAGVLVVGCGLAVLAGWDVRGGVGARPVVAGPAGPGLLPGGRLPDPPPGRHAGQRRRLRARPDRADGRTAADRGERTAGWPGLRRFATG